MTKYPVKIETLQGVGRLDGQAEFTDPANQPLPPAGGSIAGDLTIVGQTDAVELTLVPKAAQNNNVLESQDGAGNAVFVVDPAGNIVTGQIDAQPGSDIRAFRATGSAGGTADVADFNTGGAVVALKITGAGAVLMPNLPAADPHVVGELFTVAGVLHVSAG